MAACVRDAKTAIWQFVTSQQRGFEKVDFSFLNAKLPAASDADSIHRLCKEGVTHAEI